MKQGLRVRRPQKWPRRPATLFPPDLSIHSRGFTELQKVFDCVRQHSRLAPRRDGHFGRPATGRPHPANQRDNRSLATHLAATDRSQSGLDDTWSDQPPPEHRAVKHAVCAVHIDDLDLALAAPGNLLLAALCSRDSAWSAHGGGGCVLRTCCLRRDRIHTGCTIPASPVAFACPVAEHPGGLP